MGSLAARWNVILLEEQLAFLKLIKSLCITPGLYLLAINISFPGKEMIHLDPQGL